VDPRRIAVAGFSDGASYALILGLANGDLFASVAAFSPGFLSVAASPVGRPRIFISHGLKDEILPVDRSSRPIVSTLGKLGYDVTFRSFDGRHSLPPEIVRAGMDGLFR
jgi:phospholipase/carboxylesterase